MMRLLTMAAMALVALTGHVSAQTRTVGVSLASDTFVFYTSLRKGMEDRAKELGWNLRFVSANEDVVAQVNGVLDLISQKVDGILISPIDARATRSAYEAAKKAGIPIISVARHADSPDQTAFVAMDEVQIGRDIARWIVDALGKKGDVALIAGPSGAATFRNISSGLAEVFSTAPDIKIVFNKETFMSREEGLRVGQDIMVAYPDVKAIYVSNDETALGVIQAVAAAGKNGKVLITGMNGIPPAMAALRKGDLSLTVELNPQRWGRLGVDTMEKWLKGDHSFDRVNVPHVLLDTKNVPR
jgi:ribose transport system substrate-binding protein